VIKTPKQILSKKINRGREKTMAKMIAFNEEARRSLERGMNVLADQIGFVTPSAHKGKPILRFAIVNPWTKESDISAILATL